ncbi:MAG: LamB/YcsF family protein [Clostridia bacterium]|nr:LamB/YcsF family protein [Clostridia bacterium]
MLKNYDLNADIGERFGIYHIGNDEALMPYITSANIACGFHAGDPDTMYNTVALCKKYNIHVGAHPGYYDLKGFGRRSIPICHDELYNLIVYQLGAMLGMCKALDVKLVHVKPHGALYNDLAKDYDASKVVVRAVMSIDSSLVMFGLPGSETERACLDYGLCFYSEVFADRAYNDDGSLVDRKLPGALIESVSKATQRMVELKKSGRIKTINNNWIHLKADTICLHGDGDNAILLAQSLSQAFQDS